MSVLNISAYRFVALQDLPDLREALRKRCAADGLKGTVLLAPEGINLFLAGDSQRLRALIRWLREDARFAALEVKESWSAEQPFNRMLVKIKREIITMRAPQLRPADGRAAAVDARTLKGWLDVGRDDQGREVVMLDTRNGFEVEIGSFAGARELGLRSFGEFPERVDALLPELAGKAVVTFCTGGIRCEKAALYLAAKGVANVLQLDGGILRYFETVGGAHYRGECFVFDRRVALTPALEAAGYAECFNCRAVLSPAEQQSPSYVIGRSCPRCASVVS
ncbi:MAG: sulfurtransferase [Burkholderiales bacterium]|nr:sulfurtransferase [Burkholderiales bacterium]